MRETLALALVRAEFCRACAAEQQHLEQRPSETRLHAALARLWRLLRARRRFMPRRLIVD